MINDKINIILLGANYYGMMASSQRVHNLFAPLVEKQQIILHNIVNYQDVSLIGKDVEVAYPKEKGRIANSWRCMQLSKQMLKQWYAADKTNILYHYGYPSMVDYPVLRSARKLGYKIVFDIVENIYAYSHKNASFLHRMKNYTSFRLASHMGQIGDMCFGISDTLVTLCEQLTQKRVPVHFLPISVDIEKILKFKQLQNNSDEIAVYYGGSFGQKDGISYLIEGFTLAWQQDMRLRLNLTGKIAKESAGELEQLINQSAAKDAIQYLGCLPTEEYYERMTNSDILCMLRVNSVFANSGFPFKLGEYLTSGNAVIATRTTDVEKYLTNQENAILIKPEDANLIANAILTMAKDETLRRRIGEVGQLVAKENFDAPKVAEYLYNYLSQL